jgi:hypothetical protein
MNDSETDPNTPQHTLTATVIPPVKEPKTNGKPPGDADAPPPVKVSTPAHPGKLSEKVALAAYLLIWVAVLLPTIWWMIDRLNASALAEVSVGWEMPAGVTLNPGPAAFRYDATQKKLVHYGVITAERKLELRALFAPAPPVPANAKPADAASTPTPQTTPSNTNPQTPPANPASVTTDVGPATVARMEALRRSYSEAIDNLAYLGTVRQGDVISLLLLLGGLGGALGAILRSLVDFAGNASYTQALDLSRWWPLYFTRPLVGGILGFVLIVLLKAQLLTGGNPQPGSDSFWWLGVAVLGGFSTVDVTLRLRMAAKALFGGEGSKKEDGEGSKKENGSS